MAGKRVLVVDDEKYMVRLMEYNLRRFGYDVDVAFDGEMAIRQVNEHVPDLILLDIRMPTMDGFEVCRVLKEDPKTSDIPVIIVSIIADKEKAETMGARAYILKPFTPSVLLEEVKEVFEKTNERNAEFIINGS